MWDLEYLLLFGVPGNKIEILDGKGRWTFPFLERRHGEAHFEDWLRTVCRWKGVGDPPTVVMEPGRWQTRVGGVRLELAPRPIDVRIPIDGEVFKAFYHNFYRRELWPDQPEGRQTGYDHFLDDQDVQVNLFSLLERFAKAHGGQSSGRTAVVLSDAAAVEPDAFYFARTAEECMIHGDYFAGAPDLIAEVLTPPSRSHDRGARMDVYRRAGVRHYWLVDPPVETVEVYELESNAYRLAGTYHGGERFQPVLFPGETVSLEHLFWTQEKRHRVRSGKPKPPAAEPEPIPEWLVAPGRPVGLEYFFYLGHPERRWEIWNNRAPNVLAFGSPAEARHRFRHFLHEICRWEQTARPSTWTAEADREEVEVGRFHLMRRGRLVYLDVTVDGRKYRELLKVWTRREAWDWGEGER